MKALRSLIVALVAVTFTAGLALNFAGCSKKMSPMGPESNEITGESVQSNVGPIKILRVDQSKINIEPAVPTSPRQLFKYTNISQYFVERFVESDRDVTLKVGDGTTGESKVEFKKFNLPESMTVYFEWAPDDETYTGTLDCREYQSQSLAFNDSVKVELSYKMAYLGDVDESSIALYMWDESDADWESIETEIDYGNKRVKAYIGRFGRLVLFHIQNGERATLYKVQDTDYYARKYLEAHKGGKLEVEGPGLGKSFIEIKENDLPDNMTVSFQWAPGEAYEGLVNSVEYGSADLLFNNPVLVRVSYKNAKLIEVNEDSIALFVYIEGTENWERLSSVVDQDHQEVDAYLTRFGKIALFYIEGGLRYDIVKLGQNVFYAKKLIKSHKGGRIEVGNKDTGKSRIKFRAHDLPMDMEIRFEWAACGTLVGMIGDLVFGPHGTHFNSPVELELSYKMADLTGVDEDKLAVFYWNEDTGMWELIGGIPDKGKKKIRVYLTHFSRYALAHSQ